jgi:DNA-binding response OmpR family regulator
LPEIESGAIFRGVDSENAGSGTPDRLSHSVRHSGHPVSRSTIVEQVWRLNVETMSNVVDAYINYRRRKVDSGHDRPLL